MKYIGLKNTKGEYDIVFSKGQNEPSTSENLSHESMLIEITIKRDANFAEGLSIIGKCNPELKKEDSKRRSES